MFSDFLIWTISESAHRNTANTDIQKFRTEIQNHHRCQRATFTFLNVNINFEYFFTMLISYASYNLKKKKKKRK